MFENRSDLSALRSCMLAAGLVLLAGCNSDSADPTAAAAAPSSDTGGTSTGGTSTGGTTQTPPPGTTTAVPANLTATAGNAQATLAWSASSGASSYNIKRSTTSGGPYSQLGTATSTSYTDKTASNATTYFYVVNAVASTGTSADSAQVSATPAAALVSSPPVGSNCGLKSGSAVVFCDTFDAPAGIGNRSGDLNGNVWGVSRTLSDVNFGQGAYNSAPATALVGCNGTTTVRPPNDVIICNGQLREATNDNAASSYEAGTVTALAMYPKQPFDFAGRTGTVAFDVSNDGHGMHAVWPEFWVTNLPIPVPFNHFSSWVALPEHGFGVRLSGYVGAGQYGLCPNGNNLNSPRWTVDSTVVSRNYVYEDVGYAGLAFGTASAPGPLRLTVLDCVIAPADGSGAMNHVEVQVSQNQIDVYATDAGVVASASTLKHIATITNANLTFTRGLIWLEDVHYNADKATTSPDQPSQRQHTFVWDNVAFDGPFTYRDFSYDALDANQVGGPNNTWNLGKFSDANQTASWNVANMPANPQATAVRVLFNFNQGFNPAPSALHVTVNGHAHSAPWPYPDTLENSWRTFAVTVPITDLVAGTNVVQLGSDQAMVSSNVNIVLVDVPGGVPVLPGNSTTYPGSN
jgi:hypothetical protein